MVSRSEEEMGIDEETVREMMMRRRWEWLGHVARMPDHRIPKSVLFGWLSQPRPHGGQMERHSEEGSLWG